MAFVHALEINSLTTDNATGPELTASWTWPGGLLAEQDVTDLAQGWFRALRALVDHAARPDAGGFTPSDLTLVSLDQDEIDEFEDEMRAEWETSK